MTLPPYAIQVWHDEPTEDTPISKDRLTHMEQGISNADQRARDALSGLLGKASTGSVSAKAEPRGAWQANTGYLPNAVVVQGGRAFRAPSPGGVPARAVFTESDWEAWAPAGGSNVAVVQPGADVSGLADNVLVFETVPLGTDGNYVFPKGDKGDPGDPGPPGGGGGAAYDVAPGSSTAVLQAALNAGEGVVRLGPGVYSITTPLIIPRRCGLWGQGGATHLVAATAGMPAVIQVGNGGPCDRWQIRDLVIDCNNNAVTGVDVNVVGTTGASNGEPDSQGQIENLYINDPTSYGIWYRGADTQAIVTRRVRVRRAGVHGFYIQAPDCWWDHCEATTTGTTGAGFMVAGANGHYNHCKAWYCRGYGWDIQGTRNTFTGCESQDTALHGWFIEYDKNTFTGCFADSAGRADIGGLPNNADGFYFAGGASTVIVGCIAFDRAQGVPAQQRYGFNVPAADYTAGRIVGIAGYGNINALLNQR